MRPHRAAGLSPAAELGAFLTASAAASALVALGSRAQAMPPDPEGLTWTRGTCARCGGVVLLGARGQQVLCARSEGAASLCLEGEPLAPFAAAIAGLVLVAVPGAGPRLAVGLAREPGLALAGGDGQARVAAVWEVPPGATLAALAARLHAAVPDLVAVQATFLGRVGP